MSVINYFNIALKENKKQIKEQNKQLSKRWNRFLRHSYK